jgi:hypothetical protein
VAVNYIALCQKILSSARRTSPAFVGWVAVCGCVGGGGGGGEVVAIPRKASCENHIPSDLCHGNAQYEAGHIALPLACPLPMMPMPNLTRD